MGTCDFKADGVIDLEELVVLNDKLPQVTVCMLGLGLGSWLGLGLGLGLRLRLGSLTLTLALNPRIRVSNSPGVV